MGDQQHQHQGPQPLKFGFTKQQKNPPKARVLSNADKEDEASRQLVTGIEGSELKTVEDPALQAARGSKRKEYVVPKLEDTFKLRPKFVPSFKPPPTSAEVDQSGEKFELAKEDTRPKITSYGLERRARPEQQQQQQQQQQHPQAEESGMEQRRSHTPPANAEDYVLQRDVESLPEDTPLEVSS